MEQFFNQPPQSKIEEYIERFKKGESLESFGDIPESWKKEILARGENNLESSEIHTAIGIESIENVLEDVAQEHYIFTHITAPDVAQDIYNSQFEYSLGTGLSGTMTFTGGNGAIEQIKKILNGESPHRNLTGMFILILPKKLLPSPGPDVKINSDTIENFLIDRYDSMAEGKIPKEFNFGYLKGDTLYYKNS